MLEKTLHLTAQRDLNASLRILGRCANAVRIQRRIYRLPQNSRLCVAGPYFMGAMSVTAKSLRGRLHAGSRRD